jgi:hypothetical protein
MISAEALVPFVALALFGSMHCAGMCGGFALTAASGPAGASAGASAGLGGRAGRIATYALGKALCYAVLGVALSLAAHGAAHATEPPFADTRRVLAWVAGAVLVASGLNAMGLRLRRATLAPRGVVTRFAAAWQTLRALPAGAQAFAMGFLTGLLPCGLSWSALALASQVGPASAALGMLVFGAATTPALAAVGLARWLAPASLSRASRFLLGPALVAFGVLTAARGGFPLEAAPRTCCEASAPARRSEQRDRDDLQHADQDTEHAAEDLDRP